MNTAIEKHGHHPHLVYTPAAWRHYTRRLALLERLASLEFESALDVGCAEGYFMAAIAAERGAEVWGVDLSDRAVAVAASRYDFLVGAAEATALPFADGAFDLVYSTEVIEHVLDPPLMLAEMRRVARSHVLVTTPVSQTPDDHEPDYDLRDNGHVNDFGESSVRRLFGPEADLRTFRCNATFAVLTGFGRKLRLRPRNFFYQLDHRMATRFGSPHGRFVPLSQPRLADRHPRRRGRSRPSFLALPALPRRARGGSRRIALPGGRRELPPRRAGGARFRQSRWRAKVSLSVGRSATSA